jgi:acetoin utilization protein AcuC
MSPPADGASALRAAFVWDDALADYRFTDDHPLNPRRLELTLELIRRLDLVDETKPARTASDEELRSVHAAEFIAAVRGASEGTTPLSTLQQFGLGSGDVPIVRGMHEAAAHIAGATLRAAQLVMSGEYTRAFSIAGGLHHARHAEASGFCVYNDLACAIRWMQQTHHARVMYIDIDAHHGDGVQQIFYADPDVLTISFHESGAFLYPGTGFIDEMGEGDGYGYSVNVPLDPHTDTESFLDCVRELVPLLADAFAPDVIMLQAGCDAHILDPLTHLRCTTSLYRDAVRIVSDVADAHCDGRIVATGGGGYAIYTVVPRAWTIVWATLTKQAIAEEVPLDFQRLLRHESGQAVPATLIDPPDAFATTSLMTDARVTNRHTVDAVRRRCVPLITGWGLGF